MYEPSGARRRIGVGKFRLWWFTSYLKDTSRIAFSSDGRFLDRFSPFVLLSSDTWDRPDPATKPNRRPYTVFSRTVRRRVSTVFRTMGGGDLRRGVFSRPSRVREHPVVTTGDGSERNTMRSMCGGGGNGIFYNNSSGRGALKTRSFDAAR